MARREFPCPVVGAFIINPRGELLLTKSASWSNLYTVPGGHVELGETMEAALRREILEETGLRIEEPRFLTAWDFVYGEEFVQRKHMVILNFIASTATSDVTLDQEAQAYLWIDPVLALELPLEQYTRRTIEEFVLPMLGGG